MLTIFFLNIIILFGGFMNYYEKQEFVLKNKLRYFPIEKVLKKCFDNNLFIRHSAIEELVRRNPSELPISDGSLILIVKKMTIEQIYELVILDIDTPLFRLAKQELKRIFEYYERINPDYYKKIIEDENENKSFKKVLKLIRGGKE